MIRHTGLIWKLQETSINGDFSNIHIISISRKSQPANTHRKPQGYDPNSVVNIGAAVAAFAVPRLRLTVKLPS